MIAAARSCASSFPAWLRSAREHRGVLRWRLREPLHPEGHPFGRGPLLICSRCDQRLEHVDIRSMRQRITATASTRYGEFAACGHLSSTRLQRATTCSPSTSLATAPHRRLPIPRPSGAKRWRAFLTSRGCEGRRGRSLFGRLDRPGVDEVGQRQERPRPGAGGAVAQELPLCTDITLNVNWRLGRLLGPPALRTLRSPLLRSISLRGISAAARRSRRRRHRQCPGSGGNRQLPSGTSPRLDACASWTAKTSPCRSRSSGATRTTLRSPASHAASRSCRPTPRSKPGPDCGHMLMWDAPDRVVASARELVA